jgi:hypothetical protein
LFVVAVRALAHGTVDTRTNPTQGLELPAHSHGLTGITADADQKTASQFPGISSERKLRQVQCRRQNTCLDLKWFCPTR